jgi:1-pyrroline-5-carboxylate dehydrogenase
MREWRFELAAWMVLEAGKTRAEADAEVAEAIDFCEFYGREMLRLAGPRPLTPVPNERNELVYLPLGAGAVIPPWNFPLAILCGMTTAAIVCGNTVVLKPSSDTPAIAHRFVEALEAAGMPPGVVNLLTGPGGEIGDRVVDHPRIRFVAFTGSRDVGLRINERAAKSQPGQRWIKRVICEMGGKDAIVVDRDADLDAAVEGVVVSAFGYQGQKCSACSRAIVDAAVYGEFLDQLRQAVARVKVGPADDPDTFVGPLINEKAQEKVLRYVEIGRQEGRHLIGGEEGDPSGYYVRPAVFADVPPRARLAQEEVFGPVLAVIKARDFEDAMAIANDSEYGLTGSVYTNDRDKLEEAKRRFFVGNLYLNRKCTGALVGAHPFGGFHMSGTDSKAGGGDYLLLFLQAKAIAEKVK